MDLLKNVKKLEGIQDEYSAQKSYKYSSGSKTVQGKLFTRLSGALCQIQVPHLTFIILNLNLFVIKYILCSSSTLINKLTISSRYPTFITDQFQYLRPT